MVSDGGAMRTRRRWVVGITVLVAAGCAPAEDTGVRLVAGMRSPWPMSRTAIAITAPAHGAVVQNPVDVELIVQHFEAGVATAGADERGIAKSPQGQHVHLIVDNEPYQAVYDLSQPVRLPELAAGPHAVRAFPARQWHESVKLPGTFEMVQFYVGEETGSLPVQPGAPLLTYSRPVGTYSGADADSILVDFYVRNATLGPNGHKVRLTVNDDVTELIAAWIPYYILGLEPGEHTVQLELLDPAGRRVPGAYNITERVITVEP